MAHVLILTLNFPPDGVSTAHLSGELAQDLAAAGHQVMVVTTTPHQERDLDAQARQPLRRRWWSPVATSSYGEVPVRHVLMPPKARSIPGRLLQWVWLHAASTADGLLRRPPDVILAISPPLTMGVNAWLLGRCGRAPYIYTVQELYPDVAIELGYVNSTRLIDVLKRLERFVYGKAAAVTVISAAMRDTLLAENRVDAAKVHVIQNFVDTGLFAPGRRDNGFRTSCDIGDEYVVAYAGNMGPAQQLDSILDAAALLRSRTDLRFLLVGGGTERDKLKARAAAERLDNCMILPHQSYTLMPSLYGASDLCVVPLAGPLNREALPSKIYKIMSAARPVLALASPRSALARIVEDAGCGVVVDPGSPEAIAGTVSSLADDPARARALGAAGRSWVEANASREAVAAQYLHLIEACCRSARPARRERLAR